jgi:3-dehydroquinate synthetase
MVGDLTGFVAATYMRGLPYVLAPTTLLAMVDASVGGKTGVNTSHGKNLIGAFHPPAAVAADPLALVSLPAPEYRGGLAEAVKHGLIADGSYFEWIEARADSPARSASRSAAGTA